LELSISQPLVNKILDLSTLMKKARKRSTLAATLGDKMMMMTTIYTGIRLACRLGAPWSKWYHLKRI